MLSKDHFYFEMFKKYIVAFSHIISDIHILRKDENGVVKKDITVPISYSTKSKLFQILQRKENLDRKIKAILPRITFVISGMQYDVSRKINNLNECSISTTSGKETFQYIGVPYNFTIEMGIWSYYMNDLLQIIEQMATFFKPDYSLDVKEIPEFGITKSIPVTLDQITFDIQNEFDVEDRILKADASFLLRGYLYPPISNDSIIRHMHIAMKDLDSEKTLESIKLDWDFLNETVNTTIKDGQIDYQFASTIDPTINIESIIALEGD